MNKQNRKKIIIKTSIIGIITNILLSTFKAIIGLMSSSIAIILDAINNLTDALSSIITIVGTKLAGKEPDKEHPFGHGRIEYLSALVISIIILYAGITSSIESIEKIIHPIVPNYKSLTLIILIIATITKIILGLYYKKTGKKVNSNSLINSGNDALLDSIISSSTILAALIYIITKISLEAYLGIIISIIIIKSGISMIKITISQILGERVESKITTAIKKTVSETNNVLGAFDLILNNYGPDIYIGSIHIEVEDTLTAAEIDKLTRLITNKVYQKHNVILTAIGIYSININDKETINIRKKIESIILEYKNILQLHGFYLDKKNKTIYFDIIFDIEDTNKKNTYNEIYNRIKKSYPRYKIIITMDIDDMNPKWETSIKKTKNKFSIDKYLNL